MILNNKNLTYDEVKDVFNKIELILKTRKEMAVNARSSINWDACEAIADVLESNNSDTNSADIKRKKYMMASRSKWPFFRKLRKLGLDLISE